MLYSSRFKVRANNIRLLKEQAFQKFKMELASFVKLYYSKHVQLHRRVFHSLYILFKAILECTAHELSMRDLKLNGPMCQYFSFDYDCPEKAQISLKSETLSAEEKADQLRVRSEHEKEWVDQTLVQMCNYEEIVNWGRTFRIMQEVAKKTAFQKIEMLMMVK